MGNAVTLCPTDGFEGDEDFDTVFEVDESAPLGTGKFSIVYPCWRRAEPELRFALKVISTSPSDHMALARIYEEITILKMLGNHPGIISIVDMDESRLNMVRIAMELCEGGELYDRIQQKQFYPEHEAKVLVRNLLEAAAFVHSRGVMHRDLKPENILLQSKVSHTDCKISDFGLARASRDYPRRLPRSHSICGSDFYLAPEVIKQEEYGREIDIWALGVIAYVVMSGSLPFFHNVLHKLYRQIVERDLSFPEQAWRSVSKGAQDFILRLLQVRPGDRLTAEQCLSHPWLRTAGTAESSSFASNYSDSQYGRGAMGSNVNYYAGPGGEPAVQSRGTPYPLAHAHKVGNDGPPAAQAQRPSGGGYGPPPGGQAYR